MAFFPLVDHRVNGKTLKIASPLFDHRIGVFDLAGQDKNDWDVFKTEAGVVAQKGSIDAQGTAEIVAHEKYRPAAFIGRVFRQGAAAHLKGKGVAIAVNAPAAAASGGSGAGRIGAKSDALVVLMTLLIMVNEPPMLLRAPSLAPILPRSLRPPKVDPTT